ncbi:MAG: hypothetical protein ACPLY7_01285 [Microgenomates group bacterium]
MKKITKIVSCVSTATTLALINPLAVLAAQEDTTINIRPTGYETITTKLTIPTMVSGGIRLILVIAALLFFFMLVVGGIQWIISGGDKAGSENARKRITSALVGLAIVFSAWAIALLVKALFGVDIFTLNIPTLYQQ